MDDKDQKQARAILDACEKARNALYGPWNPKQRVGQAQLHLSAYENAGALGASVRDFRNSRTLAEAEGTLAKLENIARRFAESE